MFDFDHGQTGKAPNGIEIHPVIKIEFLCLAIKAVLHQSNGPRIASGLFA
jgi:hypothetical protein